MSDDGPAMLSGLLHQLCPIELPGLEDDGHLEEVLHGVLVRVKLPVVRGEGAKVRAVHGGEGSQLAPAKVQLFRAHIPGGTCTDVRE